MVMTALVCCAAFSVAWAQSPMTPREAMSNCEMVDPAAHIENGYTAPEAFTKRNDTLDAQVMAWASAQMTNIDMDFDPVGAQQEMERKRDEMMRRAQMIDPQQQMVAMQRMMADMMAYYKLGEKEMEQLANMGDKQAFDFIAKRAQQLGVPVKAFDPSQYGAVVFEQDENEADLAEKRRQAFERVEELEQVVQNFKNRNDAVNGILASLERSAEEKCGVEMDKWRAEYDAIPTGAGPGGVKDREAVERLVREATDALIRFEQQNWVAPAREQLVGLMADAEAADEANAESLELLLSVTDDAMARQALMQKYNHTGLRYSVYVWGLYKKITQNYCRFVMNRGFFN